MADKIYLRCSAKARQTQFGEVLNIGIKADDLAEFCQQHTNARGYVNLTISKRRDIGQYGDTHSVYLDTYEPKTGTGAREVTARHSGPVEVDDIPF
jgi:hypothetical protein